MTHDLIVIGGGAGGLSLASGAAQLGVKVLLVDKGPLLGGDCLHYGCVPSKALIKSGKVAHSLATASQYGLKVGPWKTHWKTVTDRIKGVQDVIQEHDSQERFERLGCEVVFGMARFVGSHEVQIKEKVYSAKKIVVATGSRPAVPSIEGLEKVGFLTNETLFSTKRQPKTLLIIGAGVIAVEFAQAMSRLGTKVTMAYRGEVILKNESREVRDILAKRFDDEGIERLSGVTFSSFSQNSEGKTLHFVRSKKKQQKTFEEVLVATGRKANLDLDLEKAGVLYDRFIPVDRKLRTNQRHILAIGDVNGQMPFTHGANYEAGVVLSNEILHIPSKTHYASLGYTIFTDPEVASIGSSGSHSGFRVVEGSFLKQDRALCEGENEGIIRITIDRRDRVVGCQIVAPRAGEMIREWQLAIAQKMKLSKIARSTFIYPTFGEISKWTAGSHYAPKLFSKTVKKVLRWLFGYKGKG